MEGVSDVYLSTAQACGRLNIGRDTLRKRIREGELVAIKGTARNSHVKISLASIEAYEERRRMTCDGVAA
jgi:excisionase family DNA binding protein